MTGTATKPSATNTRPTGLLGEPTGDLQLRVHGTEHDGRVVRITSAKCSVGSAANCTLRLNAAGVQPLHCLILRGTNGTVIRRCGPHTKLNGQEFRDALLRKGDQLSIGPLSFEVVDDAAQPDPHAQRPLQRLLDAVAAMNALPRSTDSEVLESRLSRIESLLNSAFADGAPRTPPPSEPPRELAELAARLRSLESQPWLKSHDQLATRLERLERSLDDVAKRPVHGPQLDTNELTSALTTLAQGAAETRQQLGGLSQQLQRATKQWSDFHGQFESMSGTVTETHAELRDLRGNVSALRCDLTNLTDRVRQIEDRPETVVEPIVERPAERPVERPVERLELATTPIAAEAEIEEEVDPRDSTPLAEMTPPPQPEPSPSVDWEKRLKEWRASLEAKSAETKIPARPQTLATAYVEDDAADDDAEAPAAPTISFAQPTRTAPLSTLDVLRKMGRTAAIDELEDEQIASPVPPSASPRPTTPAPVEPRRETPKSAPAPATTTPHAAGDDEESIESYMERLMNRVRGEAKATPPTVASTARPASPVKPEPQVIREAVPAPATQPVLASEPVTPEKYVPRSMAPELTSNLSAMRELANQSARSAIVTSVKRRSGLAAVGKLACAVTSVAMSGVLFFLSNDFRSPTFMGGVAGVAAAAYWISQSLSLMRERIKSRS